MSDTTRFEFTRRVRPVMEVGIGSSVIDGGFGVWDVSLWDDPDATWNGDEPLWRDVSCDVIEANIELGRGRITDPFPVGTADITVDNNSGWADPSSSLADSAVGYLTFTGVDGNYVSVADFAAINFTGDFCVVMRVRVDQPPDTAALLVGKGADPDLAYSITVGVDGAVSMVVSPDGTDVNADVYAATGMPSVVGSWRWMGFAFDANDGAAGRRGTWWYGGDADDAYEEAIAWELVDTTIFATGTMTINTTTDPLLIGVPGFDGELSHLSLRSGHGGLSGSDVLVGGSTVFEFNGWDLLTDYVPPPATLLFVEDPPGSGLYDYVGSAGDWVEDPAGSGVYEWLGS